MYWNLHACVCVCMHASSVCVCMCVSVCMCVCGACIVLMCALAVMKEIPYINYHHPCVYYVSGYRRGDSEKYIVSNHVLGDGGRTNWQIFHRRTLTPVWKSFVVRKW